MNNFNIKKIKIITFLIISIIFIVIGAFRIYADIKLLNEEHSKKEKLILTHVSYLYNKQINKLKKALGSRIEYLAQNSIVKKVLKEKNRRKLKKLEKLVTTRFKVMKKSFPTLNNMKFFTDNKELIYTLDKKEDFCKNNEIPPIVQHTFTTKKAQFGVNPHFKRDKTFIFKIVIPVFDNTNFLGAIATSIDLSYILKSTKHDIESIYLKEMFLLPFLKNNLKNNDSNKFITHDNLIAPNNNSIFTNIMKDFKINKLQHIDLDNKNYHFSFNQIKIYNFLNKQIGTLSYVVDETDYIKDLDWITRRAILFPLLVLSLLIIFFSWLFNYFSNKIMELYKRTKKIIDIQDSIIVISDGVMIHECNQAFFDFLGFKNIEEFRKNYNCMCDFFAYAKNKNYLQKVDKDGHYWSNIVLNNPDKIHKALIYNKNKKLHTFEVKGKEFEAKGAKKEQIFVFNDITLLEHEKDESSKKEKLLFEQSKMASMGEMIGNIAHQWRQPLSIISTASTGIQLQNELNVLDDQKLNEACENINDSAQFLSKTIDDFRNFIKNDRQKEDYSIVEAINKTLNLVYSSFKDNNIEVYSDLKDDVVITGYPNEIIQALLNILSNAKDVLKEKNQEIKYIIINSYIEKDYYIINIKDTGGGIDTNIIKKIFEPYFTTKHKSQGTGIGLYMTYQIFTEHVKGNVTAKNIEFNFQNNHHKGAIFKIMLPLS